MAALGTAVYAESVRLRYCTPPSWVEAVNSDPIRFLQDHASCEKKASGTALHLVSHYPDRPDLVRSMIALAQEELDHFGQVFTLLEQRDAQLGPDERDPYVRGMLKRVRSAPKDFLLDRLLVFGVVEARGCERFRMLAEGFCDVPLRTFYAELARAEAQHWAMFVRLAKTYFEPQAVQERLEALLQAEGALVASLPVRCALH